MMKPLRIAALAVAVWLAGAGGASGQLLDPGEPVVRGIEVKGLQRIDPAGVRAKIYTSVGSELDRDRLSEDIKRIYRLGFFEDVQAYFRNHAEGGIILQFRIVERPTISKITYEIDGDHLDEDAIKEVVDLKRFAIVDEAAIQRNLGKIRDLYVEDGYFMVETSFELFPSGRNGMEVILRVFEGEKVLIRRVDFVGNQDLSDATLKNAMITKEGGWLAFLSNAGQFNPAMFDGDVQQLQLLYLHKGYVQAKIDHPVISLAPDRSSLSLLVRVHEGPQYQVGEIEVAMSDGEWLIPQEELLALSSFKEGETFDYMKIRQDEQAIGDAFRDLGYANAHVSSDYRPDEKTRIVDFVYRIQKGQLVHIGRIDIRGNRSTRDKVIRRELKIAEGDLYSSSKLRRSQQRVQALGFFETVELTPRTGSDPGRMDVTIDVTEQNTGTFQVGAGFSSYESFLLTATVAKENFLGRGQSLQAQATLSALRKMFSVNFFEPYFLDSRWTFAFDIFNFSESFTTFNRLRTGGKMSWGYRLTDHLAVSLTYTLEQVEAQLFGTKIPLSIASQDGRTSSFKGTLSYDSRDNRLFPSDGNFTTVSLEHADPNIGSENSFDRAVARTRFYFPLPLNMVFKTNLTLGIISTPKGEAIPLFERFFVGGIYNLRGYGRNSVGEELQVADVPDDGLRPFVIGGAKELIFNAELEFPIFAEVRIKGVLFFDAANAWGSYEPMDLGTLQASTGLGVRWHSPVGPLRFEWGWPLNPRPGDEPMVFEFTIGNSF